MKFEQLQSIVEDHFLDIVVEVIKPSPDKLRLVLRDKSFVDVRLSLTIKNRVDFHWEKTHIDGTIYRYDNFPDMKFKKIQTFPYHFHNKSEKKVVASPFSKILPKGFIDFMEFVRKKVQDEYK